MKTMSDREALARRIVNAATAQNVSFARLAEVAGEELPALTEEECKAIAVNVPYSCMYLRDAFPRAQ